MSTKISLHFTTCAAWNYSSKHMSLQQTCDLRHGCQCCHQCCMSCHTWGDNVDWGGQAKGDPRKTIGWGCQFYEEPNQEFGLSEYSTILWAWVLLTWPQATCTLVEQCWKALSHWLHWSEHSQGWGHWVWYWIAFMCFSMLLKRSPKLQHVQFGAFSTLGTALGRKKNPVVD